MSDVEHAELDVFVSHSTKDAELAQALVELIRTALNIPSERIRCTSVPGYKLPVGADADEQLRRETLSAKVFVGLVTDMSSESAYVLFELGARWGSSGFLAPLLGAGCGPEVLAGPLRGLNALSCTETDLLQFIRNIAGHLTARLEVTEVYLGKIEAVIAVSERLAEERSRPSANNSLDGTGTDGTYTPSSDEPPLSDFQIDYLLEISKPRNEGSISAVIDDRTGRAIAPYQEALELFQERGLMRYSGGAYNLTSKGWKLVDQLWALKILEALDFKDFIKDTDLADVVGLTDGQTELDELRRHVDALERDNLVKVNRNMHGWSVRILEQGVTHRKHRPIAL